MDRESRQIQYDILKGIGIILVMYGHAMPQNGYVHNIIYGFHMPLFFFCSGVFFSKKPIRESVVKDLMSLMIPWVVFSLFLVVCSIVLSVWGNGEGPSIRPLDENCHVLYYTIWFLPCLFLTRFFYRLIDLFCSLKYTGIICVVGYLAAYLIKQNEINIPFFIDSAISMLLFYHLGHCGAAKVLNVMIPIRINILLLMSYCIFIYMIEPHVNIKENIFPLYLIIMSLVPIYALYQISCRVNSKFLSYCGVASLAIMGLHHPIFDVAMYPLLNRIELPVIVEQNIMVITTLFITLITYELMQKLTPFLLGKPVKANTYRKKNEE